MSRILVTGAAGFTGRYLGERLVGDGFDLHGLVNGECDRPIPGYSQLHEGDLTNAGSLREVIRSVRPTRVVHLAAVANVAHGDITEMYLVNVVGTRNLLDALKQSGLDLSAVLLASSANIYGNSSVGVLGEGTPPRPANDYGVTKLSMEYVASIYADFLPIIVTRPFNYTGSCQSTAFLVPKIIDHAKRRLPNIELGNLDVARDFSDVRTIVDAYARLLDCRQAVGCTVNVCSGRSISINDIIGLVERESGHRMEVRVSNALTRANEVRSLCGSKARLEDLIGPLEEIPFEETVRWMLGA